MASRKKLLVLCGEQNHRCAYCGVRMFVPGEPRPRGMPRVAFKAQCASPDEVIPRSKGGKRIWENQVAACNACNSGRGTLNAHWFYEHRRQIMPLYPPGTLLYKHMRPSRLRMVAAARAAE